MARYADRPRGEDRNPLEDVDFSGFDLIHVTEEDTFGSTVETMLPGRGLVVFGDETEQGKAGMTTGVAFCCTFGFSDGSEQLIVLDPARAMQLGEAIGEYIVGLMEAGCGVEGCEDCGGPHG